MNIGRLEMSDKNKQNRSEAPAPAQRGTLTRQDIALAIFERVGGISRREAKRLTDCVIDEMVSTLISGETLKLHDFGSFLVRDKQERSGRNPRTGAPVPIEARRVVIFKASPNMKAAVNGETAAQRERPNRAAGPDIHAGGNMPALESALDKA